MSNSRRKRKRAGREASANGSGNPIRGSGVVLSSHKDVNMVAELVGHPDFQFHPVIHKDLANQLYLVFLDRINELPVASKSGHWSERSRVTAASVIAKLADHNLKKQPKQHDHRHQHAHVHVDAVELAEQIAELAEG